MIQARLRATPTRLNRFHHHVAAIHLRNVLVSKPDRRFAATGGERTMPSANVGDRKGSNMLNETIDREGELPSDAVIEPSGAAGIAASDIASKPWAGDRRPGGVKPCSTCGCTGECACGTSATKPQLVFAIGELGYDLVSEARKDSLWQAMNSDPYEWRNLTNHLESAPWDAEAVTWTLRLDATPIYAIQPVGPYAGEAYKRLADWLVGQTDERGIERVSIPGWIAGSTTLANGVHVPLIVPALRGMWAWDTKSLVAALTPVAAEAEALTNFLERVYYSLRNLGQSPEERAKNFAASNAYQSRDIFRKMVEAKLELDHIEGGESPICRQDSDCWDVMLTFFDPLNDRAARTVHRFTVDVSDVVPCTVGRTRQWFVR